MDDAQPKLEDFEKPFPRVSITATASPDGKRITLVFPQEYSGETVAIAGDNNGRHRIILSPVYGGQTIVGFVAANGVKYGKVEINPAACDLKNVLPNKSNRYWGKDRVTDILVGRLLTDLCEPKEPPATRPMTATIFDRPVPEIQKVKVTQVIEPTIEQCVDFVNEWVQKNNGVLTVEDNAVTIEVRQRIGGKKHG